MGSHRRAFALEFKDEAVKLEMNTSEPVDVVAREIGILEQMLGNWLRA